jgi:hypothetical protein
MSLFSYRLSLNVRDLFPAETSRLLSYAFFFEAK